MNFYKKGDGDAALGEVFRLQDHSELAVLLAGFFNDHLFCRSFLQPSGACHMMGVRGWASAPRWTPLLSRELLSAGKPGTACLAKVSKTEPQGDLSLPNYQLSLYSLHRTLCVRVYWCVFGLL